MTTNNYENYKNNILYINLKQQYIYLSLYEIKAGHS